MAPKNNAIKLPPSLLEQLKSEADSGNPKRRGKAPHSRKELRKKERSEKKQRNAQFHSAPKRRAEGEHDESPKHKKIRTDSAPPLKSQIKPDRSEKQQKSASLKKTDTNVPNPVQNTPRSRQEIEEENYIAYLETKLGSGKDQYFHDGLDDLFEFTSSLSFGKGIKSKPVGITRHDSSEDDNIDDGGEEMNVTEEGDISEGEDTGEDSETGEESSSDENWDEWAGISLSENVVSEKEEQRVLAAQSHEQLPTRYVPPHLRATQAASAESEESTRLTKLLKGLLNRMSEQNMATILDSIEETYRNYRRHDVTAAITKLVIDGTTSHSSLLDSYVVLYASLISALHKTVGVEFAAFVVQNVVSTYETHLAALAVESKSSIKEEQTGKEASNLMVLLSELYNFQVISCVLVFDFIRGLLEKPLDEFVVELLLKLLRNSGQQLRVDDPLALKDIVQMVQDKVAKQDAISSRTRFMIETLTNLKNNKLKKSATQSQGSEAVERMKKFLSGISKKRHVVAHEPLRVSLDDLHTAETKGKWWLVGAAWNGDPLVDLQHDKEAKSSSQPSANQLSDSKLLQLAKKHGMNTDIRRSIFVILMSSDDYIDACDRISQLNLTEVQQREIPRVLLHCCGFEKDYNPYYSLIGQHLCSLSHAHKITLQYCLWDFIRDMGESTVGGHEVVKNLNEGIDPPTKKISSGRMRNIAKIYAWWIAKDTLTLNVLKPINFTTLKATTIKFLREMFEQLFISSQATTINLNTVTEASRNRGALEQIFIQTTHNSSLATGIIVFLSAAFENPNSWTKWACGVAQDTLRTGLDIIPSL